MKISYNWIKQFINLKDNSDETSKLLTELGLEVEGISKFESIKGGLNNVVIGKVISCEKHPNADRLKVTTVDVGENENVQIVCGAPNVESGQTVAVAMIGAKLYFNDDEITIKKSKIRGENSEGMICAEDELGLGNSHDGIIVFEKEHNPGTLINKIYNIENDEVFDIGLTPNRADAMSHLGVARDLKVGLIQKGIKLELITPSVSDFNIDNRAINLKLDVKDSKKAPRYCGIVINNIKVNESPEWLKNRLKSIDITPINNVVDITNYVLHDLGQPLHAFDYESIVDDKIQVTTLKKGTKFTTLDGVERELTDTDLMICSGNKPLCMAGIYGGENSGVNQSTKSILLESAYFDPITIRKSAKHHGFNTDASYRFERGIDPNITKYALKRAAILIKDICGGIISSEIEDLYPQKLDDFEVLLNYDQIDKLIGQKIDHETIKEILTSLDIKINSITETRLGLSIPYYRNDVQREADVIEEILRVFGYNNIKSTHKLNSSINDIKLFSEHNVQNSISEILISQGYYEIMTNSLTSPAHSSLSNDDHSDNDIEILNSLSLDLSVLRQNMLFSGLEVTSHNINRKQSDLKLFEFGKTYKIIEENRVEAKKLSLYITGDLFKKNWNSDKIKSDYYYTKGIVKSLLDRLAIKNTISKPTTLSNLKEGESLFLGKKEIVTYGSVKKEILDSFNIDQEVFYVEFKWDTIISMTSYKPIHVNEIPKYPEVSRDLSILIDKNIDFASIFNSCIKIDKKLIKDISLFDVYEGNKLPADKKSYGISIAISSSDKTLSDKEIDNIMGKVIKNLNSNFGAELRN
ncbi:phenylalanine--tRNA ligase subunit beta [Flavobacteriaceae bacterium]|nr:phenylalanine--tRNA ligase subunit beta [Flavobacteriaceae bacterium]MDC1310382.1 phenylalanine--tRNA ligase subunit beta [Flavobacteriaceae bacterium]